MIRFAGLPCVNPPSVLLRCYDRLSMYNEMKDAALPLLPQEICIGHRSLERAKPELPCVVKIGNFHAGYGKARATNKEAFSDIRDLAFAADDYVTTEPFIAYRSDIRCLASGAHIWAMKRRGAGWKANTETTEAVLVDPIPERLVQYTRKAMQHLGADVLGLDFLEDESGNYWLLECNDTPGLSGFPDVAHSLADCLKQRLP
jgi:ribosomal protein S6--L-glutamate ligase